MAQHCPGHVRQLMDRFYSPREANQVALMGLRTDTFEEYLRSEDLVRGGSGPPSPDEELAVAPPGIPTAPIEVARKRPMDMTREDVDKALRAAGGVMKRAAELLGCSPTTLRDKRREVGL